MVNAANRDPRAYDDPDRLDLERNGVPRLGFGFGAHICLGWIDSTVLRGMKSMPVKVSA